MDTVVNDFVQVLRRHQVRVSPAESLDAPHALGQTGLGERGAVRDTLRTTLVILGDGRNNGKAPNTEALEEISHHVRQTIWITPEPKWGWSLGSCDMPAYEPICGRVEVVRSVDQLAGVAENLVRARA